MPIGWQLLVRQHHTGGENISPREIEEFLYIHPKIAEVPIVGLPDRKLGEVAAAWIRLAASQSEPFNSFNKFQSFKRFERLKRLERFELRISSSGVRKARRFNSSNTRRDFGIC